MVVKGTSEVTTESGMVEDLMEFLKEDLQHLFDDQGIDETKYEDKVEFEVSVQPLDGDYLICYGKASSVFLLVTEFVCFLF